MVTQSQSLPEIRLETACLPCGVTVKIRALAQAAVMKSLTEKFHEHLKLIILEVNSLVGLVCVCV